MEGTGGVMEAVLAPGTKLKKETRRGDQVLAMVAMMMSRHGIVTHACRWGTRGWYSK